MLSIKKRNDEDRLVIELEREIRRSSKGKIPKNIRMQMARRTISRLDRNNMFQMHKSMRGFADILTQNYSLEKR